jgi:hypothetical protein
MSAEEAISIFNRVYKASGLDGLLKKNSGVSVEMMKMMAGHWGMSKNKDKKTLATLLIQKMKSMEMTRTIIVASRIGGSPAFRRDKNTIPRLLNLLTPFPDGMLRSKSRANWMDLQNRNTRANDDMWDTVAERFNNRNFDSGGLVAASDDG